MSNDQPTSTSNPAATRRTPLRRATQLAAAAAALLTTAGISLLLALGIAWTLAYQKLPDVADLLDYRPALPLRVLTADGQLIGEFGAERRKLVPIAEIPQVMIDAVLSIEDVRFFEHHGVDFRGLLRAALANLGQARSQGASTITMQVARNIYLTSERTYTRKFYELLLTLKLERMLTKEQILEIYMNQIFLGQRAHGFAAAAQIYFGTPLADVTVAQAAMLAGLPKAPSAFNPISNPRRARIRQLHIIDRMLENGFITQAQAEQARTEELQLRPPRSQPLMGAEHVAEMVRQAMLAQYGEETYTRGLVVTTTLLASDQQAAYRALRDGVLNFERRQIYRGPELFIDLPADPAARDDAIDAVLDARPDNGDLLSAVVLQAEPRRVLAVRRDGVPFEITGEGLRPAQSGLSERAGPNVKIRPGAVIRVLQTGPMRWRITQLPQVEAALVALDPHTGAIRALVGGFDFDTSKFNRVTDAWRQPGSAFKPFIYSAALEKGVMPATVVNDAPLFFSARQTGGQPWQPKNYDNRFDGPMSVRRALAQSKNMTSIRVLEAVGTQSAQDWVTRFGFDAARHPPFLTMALGAGSVTPLQMASGYAVFANGGYRVTPHLITRVTEYRGRVLFEAPAPAAPAPRVIDERNAFVMGSLLQEITRSGTAARAQATLKRPDLYGKTGTTNDAIDAWFIGYQPSVVAAVWVGFDTPRNLGSRETGGGLSLPIWMSFMAHALQNVAVVSPSPPAGVIQVGGEWYFEEYGPGHGVRGLGLNDPWPGAPAVNSLPGEDAPAAAGPIDRSGILDLFRN